MINHLKKSYYTAIFFLFSISNAFSILSTLDVVYKSTATFSFASFTSSSLGLLIAEIASSKVIFS